MGDRTHCTLTVIGTTDQKTWDQVPGVIREHMDPEEEEIRPGSLGFDEVNFGTLDENVFQSLIDHELSFIWTFEPGHEYGAGFELYNAQTGAFTEFSRFEGDILLTITEASRCLENAREWQAWINENYTRGLTIT